MASKFNLDNAILVLDARRGKINLGSESHPRYNTVLSVAVNSTRDLEKPAPVVNFEDCNFAVIENLPNGAWFDPSTKTIAFNSKNSKRWHLEAWGIMPMALAA
jgi:hypothetical protein